MAIVLFAMNGQGLGHLIRSTVVSNALASLGEHPVIFSAGEYRPSGIEHFPVRTVPSLWGASDAVRKRVASELCSLAAISLPSVVVEDTHPAPIELPPGIRRVLLVRPTSFEYLVRLNENYRERYSVFLLCDSPESPSWPYDDIQTRRLTSWKNWRIIGPVYRTASEDAVRQVRARLNLDGDRPVCVFSMGGGGAKVADQQGQDFVQFLRLALQVADAIEGSGSRPRLLFVKGPYFPRRFPIPPRFEVVPEEDQMPALLKIARGAVIRAGFNTPWECIAAGTPFLPLIGTTYAEPVSERVNRMATTGLVPPNIECFWFDGEWRCEYRRIAEAIIRKHSGTPEPHGLRRLILGRHGVRYAPRPKARSARRRTTKQGFPFVIRIDDVVSEEPALSWLLDLLATRGLRATLEIVPYLMQIGETYLDRFDPSRKLFEVSQHGYAHLPHTTENGLRYEFSPESATPTPEEVEAIAKGKRKMEAVFPNRFNGGFSAPFDAMPAWLPAVWHSLGGSFVSCIGTNSLSGSPIPVRRAGVHLWDRAADCPLSLDQVKLDLSRQHSVDGHAGIVLHPRGLRRRSDKIHFRFLLDHVQEMQHE